MHQDRLSDGKAQLPWQGEVSYPMLGVGLVSWRIFGFHNIDSFLSDILFLVCDFSVLAQDLFHLPGLQYDFNDEELQRIR